jgi:hypothetical protein
MRSHAEQMAAGGDGDPHLYAVLLAAMADDWEAGGPVCDIWRGWEDAPAGSVVQLRLLAGLFRIVLSGRAPELVAFYPCLGGDRAPSQAWPVVRDVLATFAAELRRALDVAPQTNEVSRASALLVGIFDAVHRSGLRHVRLLEPGASAGLNLLVDHFLFTNRAGPEHTRVSRAPGPSGWSYGPADSPVVLADTVEGSVVPVPFRVVARRGCDLAPVDVRSADGQVRLRSFVWPFQVERHALLSAALQIAVRHPVELDTASAGEWLETQLAADPGRDVLTVVWHSISRLYWPAGEAERVENAIASARGAFPVAHVSMEYPGRPGPAEPELVVDGPEPGPPRRLGTVGDHGRPVRLGSGGVGPRPG